MPEVQAAASALTESGSSFAAVFGSATSQLSAAGQAASDIIFAGAGSAGAAYGNAAAGIIAAAAANATVNVTTRVQEAGKPDTGGLKPG